ncbi:MAG TPA: ABC transporter permease [Anaerovoracaceae bacterium]|nr:ABC transporter permease [Anaerovoracaceae bacterium]
MKILSIIRKDLKMMLSDKKALSIVLLMPIILMVILSFALKGIFMDDWQASKVNIAVVKQYDAAADLKSFDDSLHNGLLAQGMGQGAAEELTSTSDDTDPENIFFNEFLGSSEVSDIISYRVETEATAIALLNNGEISAIVILPEKYLYNMKINLLTPFRNEVAIKVLTNPDANIDGQIVQSIMQAYSDSMSSVIIGKNVLIEAAMANNIGDNSFKGMETVMTGIMDALEAVQVEVNDVTLEGRKPISSSDYYAAAMMTMFILFAAGHGGRMLLEEKENSTYQRMMVAGTSRQGILAGKFLVVFIIALLQISTMTAFSSIVLNVVWGNFLSVAAIGIAAAFAVAGVGATVAAATYRAGNYKMANIFETGIIQTMALLGGSFFPIDILPDVFQKLSFLSLNGIALKAYQKTMMGYGLEAVLGYIAVLAGIGAVFAIFAVVILRGKGGADNVGYYQAKTVKA